MSLLCHCYCLSPCRTEMAMPEIKYVYESLIIPSHSRWRHQGLQGDFPMENQDQQRNHPENETAE